MTAARATSAELYRLLAVHSLSWLAAGNLVGVLLATLLLVPDLGAALAPWSYGRWMPLHLDLLLYGWCALPLAGLLLRRYLPAASPGRLPALAIGAWSASLAFGAASWLAGAASGKLFLSWSGPALAFMAASMLLLWLTLLLGLVRAVRTEGVRPAARGALLAALLAVPWLLVRAAGPEVYPPINPDSGGATGTSLLGSTLGIVAVFAACPLLLGLEGDPRGRATRRTFALLLLHGLWFAVLDHGDHSHREPAQVLALASLLVWGPLLVGYLRRFRWPAASRRWRYALAAWGLLLLATGVLGFLPGVLERIKLTNVLVAHAHLAMAGLVTALNVLILIALGERGRLAERAPFALWQAGCLLQVLALVAVGSLEGARPGALFRPNDAVTALYALRWAGGLAMTAASIRWLAGALDDAPGEPAAALNLDPEAA